MNVGNVVSKAAGSAASGAASSAATNVASSAATSTATNAINGTSALKLDSVQNPTSNIPQAPKTSDGNSSKIIDFPGNTNPSETKDKLADILDFPGNEQNEENQQKQQLKPGDKVAPGQKVNEKGEVEDSAGTKLTKAGINVAAAWASKGKSVGKTDQIMNIKPVHNVVSSVGDQIDKTPGLKQASELLDEAGITDGVNDALSTAGGIINGDVKGTIESAKKLNKDVKKLKKKTTMLVIKISAAILLPILFLLIIIVVICGPMLGAFQNITSSGSASGGVVSGTTSGAVGGLSSAVDLLSEIPDYNSLSVTRQQVLAASALAVSQNIPYNYGGHPTGSGAEGIPSAGLDCAGFVQWSLWTGTGSNPGYLTTQAISDRIGSDFIEVSESEIQPGDIGLKRRGGSVGDDYNHTGIYAGNGQWYHAANSKKGVIRSNYSSFTIYLRYKGVS